MYVKDWTIRKRNVIKIVILFAGIFGFEIIREQSKKFSFLFTTYAPFENVRPTDKLKYRREIIFIRRFMLLLLFFLPINKCRVRVNLVKNEKKKRIVRRPCTIVTDRYNK